MLRGQSLADLLMVPTWTYAKSAEGVYVNIFAGGKIAENSYGTDVEIAQATDYPWNGKVAITVNPKTRKNVTVFARTPNRSVGNLHSSEDARMNREPTPAPARATTGHGRPFMGGA